VELDNKEDKNHNKQKKNKQKIGMGKGWPQVYIIEHEDTKSECHSSTIFRRTSTAPFPSLSAPSISSITYREISVFF